MLMTGLFGEDLFNDWMSFPFHTAADAARRSPARENFRALRTDIRETEDYYEMETDLPGYRKDEVSVKLDKGYLTIRAGKNESEKAENEGAGSEETEAEPKVEPAGRYIRRERFTGTMSRTFYIGETVQQEDIRARFDNGVLTLRIPKKPHKEVEEHKYIAIEG
jgi:HSP20 family molecular chaperone IbpA